MAYIINDCEARVVITSAAKREVAVQLPERCPNVKRWLMVDTDAPDAPFEPYTDAIAAYPPEPIADEQLGAAMLYSSGTTGRPKGILRPLPDVAPASSWPSWTSWPGVPAPRGMTYLSPAPLYHSAPLATCPGRCGSAPPPS
jgi:acyl-coenzyme A synthetase/AMP-(fatty) acid ligase